MTYMPTIEEGYDAIEAYGPDRGLWPADIRDGLEALIEENAEFSEYVEDLQRIERMLEDWEVSEDGAAINWDDLDDDDFAQPNEPESDDVEGEEEGQGGKVPVAQGEEEADEEENDFTFEIDPNMIQDNVSDMDAHFENIILKELQSDGVRNQWNTWTRDYDRLVDLPTEAGDRVDLLDTAVAKSAGPLMKDLRRLIASQSQVKRIPGMRKGRLHGPNLHRILSGDDRVFTRREEAQSLDTAITMNIDCSGSMQGKRLHLAIQTAYALGSVLSRLGIAFECVGFTDGDTDWVGNWDSYYREIEQAGRDGHIIHRFSPLAMFKFKGFEERWTADVQRRFAYCFNAHGNRIGRDASFGGTPEGCGNEFAARRLLRRPEARKIMMTLTDGEPYTTVFNGSPRDVWDRSVDMVKMIEAAGVDLIGIGIQHRKPTEYYSNSMVINQLEDMPAQLMALLKKLLIRRSRG